MSSKFQKKSQDYIKKSLSPSAAKKPEELRLVYESIKKSLSPEELNSSVTFSLIESNLKEFQELFFFLESSLENKDRMIDLGCGYGFVALLFQKMLNFKEAYGVDIVLASSKYLKILKADLEKDTLPFPDNYFDLAISFGVLDHMVFWDNFFREAYRILKPKSFLLISLTNLSSWDTRASLIFGYQPRHVEVSRKYLVGVHRLYSTVRHPVGHIHTITFRAMKELAKNYGFSLAKSIGLRMPSHNFVTNFIDRIFHVFPSFAIRYIAVFRKEKLS